MSFFHVKPNVREDSLLRSAFTFLWNKMIGFTESAEKLQFTELSVDTLYGLERRMSGIDILI